MEGGKIIDLKNLLEPFLGDGESIISHTTRRLTSAGENYGSLMLALDVKVKTFTNEKVIHLVAKLVPPNDLLQEFFHTIVTFPNEINFYSTVIPTLRDFQKEQEMEELIDYAAKYYGSRLSLDPNNQQVDGGASLILENIQVKGFVNVNRRVGCDFETSRLIIKDLATLHAVPLALKLLKPKVFNKKIKPHLLEKSLFELVDPKFRENSNEGICSLVQQLEIIAPFVDRVRKTLKETPLRCSREPFATISHNDCWVNNTMVKFKDDKAIKTKLVDFQICDYGSPAKDLIFFLFTSVQTKCCQKYYDDFVGIYHETFIEILEELKCDTSRFGFEAFLQEIDYEAKNSQFQHVTSMLHPIFAKKGVIREIEEIGMDDFEKLEATQTHKEKLVFIVKEFAKRNWI